MLNKILLRIILDVILKNKLNTLSRKGLSPTLIPLTKIFFDLLTLKNFEAYISEFSLIDLSACNQPTISPLVHCKPLKTP